MISLLVHAAAFMLAGLLVVFSVTRKEEKKFVPPNPVERPKMKLKKPKVKVKKNSKPRSSERIVTKVQKADMPEIYLPEMSGIGDGVGTGGGYAGFDLSVNLEDISAFGMEMSIGNDLEGTFYDFKRDRSGRDIPYDIDSFLHALKTFVAKGYKPSTLSRFYRSPKKLYATTVMVPPVFSVLAPEAFGEGDTAGYLWVVHYKGQLVCPASHPDGITFRFWGMADDIMAVSVRKEVVLRACWPTEWRGYSFRSIAPRWQSSSADSRKYYHGNNLAEVGDWITLKPGESQDLDIIIGEAPGGNFAAMLSVEVQGETYEKGPQGNPILPIFKTAKPTRDLIETIYENLVPGEVCVTNGPVFCDYTVKGTSSAESPPVKQPVFLQSVENETRIWTLGDGNNIAGRFVTRIGDKAVLTDEQGRQRKVPLTQFSEEDRVYMELAQPPKFNFDFSKSSKQRFFKESIFIEGVRWLPKHIDYTFSARIKQTFAGDYNHQLKVEFFAVGEEIEGDNYILLDRQESHFTPTRENKRSHSFSGATVGLRESVNFTERRGQKYGGYMIVVTDQRGVIIDYAASHAWFPGILPLLRSLPLGKHFNKAGVRVSPPRPEPIGRY
ncbi:hypothetical protein P4C99_06150 [Pontiellaceae bacterium B1224]|nr:hypothetical protein [Pontiellaceae bacterium B1224]